MKTPVLTIYSRKLPHWRMDGSTYFVTWRLAISQPPLGHDEKTLVANALKHFHRRRYTLLVYAVMDDHTHVVLAPFDGFALQEIVHSWKS
jgi:putative transposase